MRLHSSIVLFSVSVLLLSLNGCSGSSFQNTGKFYDHDGPPAADDESILQTQSVIPKVEKPINAANRPYKVMGQKFYPMSGDKPLTQVGTASWYGKQFHGKKTAIGERYDMYGMSAAHPTMELPSYARVTNLTNGRSVIVRVNDRGPFLGGRAIDMSYAAAVKLGYQKKGTTKVRIERITRKQIAAGYSFSNSKELLSSSNSSQSTAISDNTISDQNTLNEKGTERQNLNTVQGIRSGYEDPLANIISSTNSSSAAVANSIDLISSTNNVSSATVEEISLDLGTTIGNNDSDTLSITLSNEKQSALKTWSSQIGAFASERSAKEEAAHAEMMFSETGSSLPIRIVKDKNLYCVLIGDSPSASQAKLISQKISETLGVKSFVIFK